MKQERSGAWPAEDFWLKNFIEDPKKNVLPVDRAPLLDDPEWWELVAISCNGLDEPFLRRHFARMAAWIKEHPNRRPTPRGLKNFVRNWLEKEADRERRYR